MTLELKSLGLLGEAADKLEEGFHSLPEFEPPLDVEGVRTVLLEVAERMKNNLPYAHPFYIGHMMKSPHPVARLAYMLSLWINPNNHAFDGGRCSSAMEKEAVAQIAGMLDWDVHLGHLCGGGTMANLEALWVASALKPGKMVVASQQAHFTHDRLCGVLGIPFQAVPCDRRARMDVNALEQTLKRQDVGTVVVTIGTTATGSVDPLPDVLELQGRYGFRIHADAAYGGYFILADNLDRGTARVFERLPEVDSIVIDPHKHGLQPFGCGCVLFRDPSVGRLYKHDSPYTYFTSEGLHLGEISLECSRPGASAVALWATQRLLPLVQGGEFAKDLARARKGALKLHEFLISDPRYLVPFPPELDIVVWTIRARSAGEASALTRDLYHEAAAENIHLALANLPVGFFSAAESEMTSDQNTVSCVRSCIMKPEHLDWMDSIWQRLDKAAERVFKRKS